MFSFFKALARLTAAAVALAEDFEEARERFRANVLESAEEPKLIEQEGDKRRAKR